MKLVRTRLVISWMLFAAFLAALWLHSLTIAFLVFFPAIVIVRLRIPSPPLSRVERRVSWVAAFVILTYLFLCWLGLSDVFPSVLVMLTNILGTILAISYGIFTDYSKFKHIYDRSASAPEPCRRPLKVEG